MKKRIKLICALVLPYLIVLILPIFFLFILGNVLIENYQRSIMNDKQNSIEIAFDRFCQKMDEVENVSYMIAQNDLITQYVYECIRNYKHSVNETKEISGWLSDCLINGNITTVYIYDHINNRIITPNAVFNDAEIYFRYTYQLDGYEGMEALERQRQYNSMGYSSVMKVNYNNRNTEVIEFRTFFPMELRGRYQFQLVTIMETKNVFRDFYDILGNGGEFYVYDNRDRLIFCSGSEYEEAIDTPQTGLLEKIEHNDGEVYRMVCQEANKKWRVSVYLPELVQDAASGMMRWEIGLLVGLPIIASTILIIFFTFRNHREIQEILEIFRGIKKVPGKKSGLFHNSYGMIKEYTETLVGENNKYRNSIAKLEHSRKYEILDKLIRNTYDDKEEIDSALADKIVAIKYEKCLVLCIGYKETDYRCYIAEDMTKKEFVKCMLSEMIDGKFEMFDTSARETICILSVSEEDMKVFILDIIARLSVEISYKFKIDVEIGVGDIVDSLYQLNESYLQAKEVIRYRQTSGKNVYLYSELKKLSDIYYFPRGYEEKINNYVVIGKKENAKEVVRKIYKENFEDNSEMLSVNAIQGIKERLTGTLILLIEKYDFSIDNVIENLNDEQNITSYFDMVCQAIDLIAEKIGGQKKIAQKAHAVKIMEFINENFQDNNLSVKKVSQIFGLHENYISNLFTSEYGDSLSAIIEMRRIEKACELIKNTDMKISEIAQSVGYANDASFRRAFKRAVGRTPGEYRGE